MFKICRKCNTLKPETSFHKDVKKFDGLSYWCKSCNNKAGSDYRLKNRSMYSRNRKSYYERNRERLKEAAIVRLYKDSLVAIDHKRRLNSNCEICGTFEKRLVVDHCHLSGNIRGYLCQRCNVGLGWFKDLKSNLLAAAKYLQKYEKTSQK